MAIGLGLDDLQARACCRLADAELLRSLGKRHAVDNRFRQALLGWRQAILLSKPADRRTLDLVRVKDHHQHRRRAIFRRRCGPEERQRPYHGAQRCGSGRPWQNDAINLAHVRLHAGADRGAFTDGVIERAGSRIIGAAQLAVASETQPIGAAQ